MEDKAAADAAVKAVLAAISSHGGGLCPGGGEGRVNTKACGQHRSPDEENSATLSSYFDDSTKNQNQMKKKKKAKNRSKQVTSNDTHRESSASSLSSSSTKSSLAASSVAKNQITASVSRLSLTDSSQNNGDDTAFPSLSTASLPNVGKHHTKKVVASPFRYIAPRPR